MLMPLCCPALPPTFRNRDKSSRNCTGEQAAEILPAIPCGEIGHAEQLRM